MDKYLCAKLALQYFKNKKHTFEYEEYAGNKFEFKTYKVEVAVFGEDFNEPPKVESIRVRLSDDEYICLLQWQIQNPKFGFNHYSIDSDAYITITGQVEEKFFPDSNVGAYAVNLLEIKQDAEAILKSLNNSSL